MALSQVKGKMNVLSFICVLLYFTNNIVAGNKVEYFVEGGTSSIHFNDVNLLTHHRQRRDLAPSPQIAPHSVTNSTPTSIPDNKNATVAINNNSSNKTAEVTTTVPVNIKGNVSTTEKPLLQGNGTDIRNDTTPKEPKVSDPIKPDDDINTTDVFSVTPEKIKAEHNITNLTYDNHTFYNSSFIGDVNYFNSYWANISAPKADIHTVLSHSHRRAMTLKLKFDFPFYGQPLRTITVATGGFVYTGDHVHNWLAATQYIAPLMSNFDTTMTNDSVVKLSDDGTKFTVFWENVTLQEDKTKPFTFALTLYNNGDIVFAYKTIPIPITDIKDVEHPVKVGISDAYITDKILYFVRRKTIYEYHRISFMDHEISNHTILKLTALPTCLQYNTCEACANHQTSFNCSWCNQTQRCSSGMDRNKQDWILRNCDKNPIWNATLCPKATPKANVINHNQSDLTTYFTDTKNNPYHDAIFKSDGVSTAQQPRKSVSATSSAVPRPLDSPAAAVKSAPAEPTRSPIGAVMAAFVVVVMVSSLAAWVLYAFKNPHTRSGQFLIKYRPSQWRWKRGEARYTAATIHM